jgi:SAM-dependent MidA family methyltransferase
MTLLDALLAKIRDCPGQRLTFAEYMDWALYDPQWGYYGRGQVAIHPQGDFVTAPALGPDFGELLSRQFAEMEPILGNNSHFTLLEMGAGDGSLALHILRYCQSHYPDFYLTLNYQILEKSPQLQKRQQETLRDFCHRVTWVDWQDLAPQTLVGCCFSNELVDALPVHRVILKEGQLQEVYVTYQDQQIIESIAPLSTAELAQYFSDLGIELDPHLYGEGYCTEVNLSAKAWLAQVSEKLKKGYVLTIDYGYCASKYYHPQRRDGTLQCYYQNRYHNNPYLYIGDQDITSHVNFTALEQWGQEVGLQKLGFTQQALFLMNLGLGDRLTELTTSFYSLPALLQKREALHQLIDPLGLGKFGVLLQAKGLNEQESLYPLQGFRNRP